MTRWVWLLLLAGCRQDGVPSLQDSGGTPVPPPPPCPLEPCASEVATAQAPGGVGQGWFGQQVAVARSGQETVVFVGAPGAPGAYVPTSASLLTLPDLSTVVRWESTPFNMAGSAVAATVTASGEVLAAVGAPSSHDPDPHSGTVYVVTSSASAGRLEDAAEMIVHGDATEFRRPRLGVSVEWLALIDTDPGLVVVAPGVYNAPTTELPSGSAVYLLDRAFGEYGFADVTLRALRSEGVGLMFPVAWDGDADGIGDLTVVESPDPAEADRVHRFAGPWSSDLSVGDASASWVFGSYADGESVKAIEDVGDLTGDGLVDLVVGTSLWSDVADRSGAVWLITDSTTGGDGFGLGRSIQGTEAGDGVGADADAGDIDQDGVPDLVVGAGGVLPSNEPGKVAVFFGPISDGVHVIDEAAVVIHGEAVGDFFGNAVLVVDAAGDARADLLVGANGWGNQEGKVYYFDGSVMSE